MAIVESTNLLPSNAYDEVLPGIFVSEAGPALSPASLVATKFTHVLNCCEGTSRFHVDTGPSFYPPSISYLGIPAVDSTSFQIYNFFEDTSRWESWIPVASQCPYPLSTLLLHFWSVCLHVPSHLVCCVHSLAPVNQSGHSLADLRFISSASGGRVLVHCREGVSRSATIVLAHMVLGGSSLPSALQTLRRGRSVHPNEGFVRQLAHLAARRQCGLPAGIVPCEPVVPATTRRPLPLPPT
jgi:dual specificity phosphatase 3